MFLAEKPANSTSFQNRMTALSSRIWHGSAPFPAERVPSTLAQTHGEFSHTAEEIHMPQPHAQCRGFPDERLFLQDLFSGYFPVFSGTQEGFNWRNGRMGDRKNAGVRRKRKRSGGVDYELGLEEFLARNANLQGEAWRLYEQLKELDGRTEEIQSSLGSEFGALEAKFKNLKKRKPSKALLKQADKFAKESGKRKKEVGNLDETKICIAQQGYDIFDRVVRELDQRIALFETSVIPNLEVTGQSLHNKPPNTKSAPSQHRQGNQNPSLNPNPAISGSNGTLARQNGMMDVPRQKRQRMRMCLDHPNGLLSMGFMPGMSIPFPFSMQMGLFGLPGPSQALHPGHFVVEASEPVYCWCQQIAYGEMISCDNPDCPYEWFHYECVGMTKDDLPKHKWYCPVCRERIGPS